MVNTLNRVLFVLTLFLCMGLAQDVTLIFSPDGNVSYSSKDAKGNEYIIYASEGEIDYNQPNTIYLTKVKALIKLIKSSDIQIVSDFG